MEEPGEDGGGGRREGVEEAGEPRGAGDEGREGGGGDGGGDGVHHGGGQGDGQEGGEQEVAGEGAEVEPGQDAAGGLAAEADAEEFPDAGQQPGTGLEQPAEPGMEQQDRQDGGIRQLKTDVAGRFGTEKPPSPCSWPAPGWSGDIIICFYRRNVV